MVRLQLLPAGAAPGSAQKVVEFTRNRVSLEAQASHKAMRTVTRNGREVKIGIITVPSFYQDYDASRAGAKDFRSTTRDVQRLIGELRKDGAEALIMDLRANGGGYLPEAESLTGLFIDRGPVVQLRDTTGRIEVDDDPDPSIFYSGPLIVLVDRFSASASEIFAGAIQDYGRGLIIGQQTYGKGTVQNAHPLNYTIFGRKPELGQLNVTIGKYYRITGESTQDRGVTPDISIPSLIDANEVGESTRDRALPWDHIEPATFKTEGDLKRDGLDAAETARRAHGRQRRLPLFARGHRRARRGPQSEDPVAQPEDPRGRAQATRREPAGARERAARGARRTAVQVARGDQGRRRGRDHPRRGHADRGGSRGAPRCTRSARRRRGARMRRTSCIDAAARRRPEGRRQPFSAAAGCTDPSSPRRGRSTGSGEAALAAASESAVGTVSARVPVFAGRAQPLELCPARPR